MKLALREQQDLLDLVKEHCNKDKVADLLRTLKDSGIKEIKVSGRKDELVYEQLKGAIDRNQLKTEDVYAILCEAEENGSQHIFLYKPVKPQFINILSDVDSLKSAFMGQGPMENNPHVQKHPQGYSWADVRKTPTGWIAKLYHGFEQQVFVRDEEAGEGLVRKLYRKVSARHIYLARWHNGLLEVRVPRSSESERSTIDKLVAFSERLAVAIDFDLLDECSLMTACNNMIKDHTEGNKAYRLGDITFIDDGTGSASFSPPSEEHDVFDGSTREQAIKLFKSCDFLIVNWLLPPDFGEEGPEIKTIIGKFRSNEILIQSRTTQRVIDYVTNKLREFGR